jgi:hypothetical protein
MARMRCGHGADLGPAELAVEGVHLPVDVGLGDHVEIDQGDPADGQSGPAPRRPLLSITRLKPPALAGQL